MEEVEVFLNFTTFFLVQLEIFPCWIFIKVFLRPKIERVDAENSDKGK